MPPMNAEEPRPIHRPGRFATRMASGVFALVPILVTFVVLRWVFNLTAGILLPVIESVLGPWPPVAQAILAVLVLFLFIYLLGEVTAHVVGRRILALGEAVVLRLPFVKTVYSISKQVVSAFQGPGARAFKAVVYVEFPRQGIKAVAFVTSSFTRDDGSRWSTIFVPTTPNPTTGFLQLVPDGELERTSMSVEEGIKMIMSLGVLRPDGAVDESPKARRT